VWRQQGKAIFEDVDGQFRLSIAIRCGGFCPGGIFGAVSARDGTIANRMCFDCFFGL
jgi:hypothetical protein